MDTLKNSGEFNHFDRFLELLSNAIKNAKLYENNPHLLPVAHKPKAVEAIRIFAEKNPDTDPKELLDEYFRRCKLHQKHLDKLENFSPISTGLGIGGGISCLILFLKDHKDIHSIQDILNSYITTIGLAAFILILLGKYLSRELEIKSRTREMLLKFFH